MSWTWITSPRLVPVAWRRVRQPLARLEDQTLFREEEEPPPTRKAPGATNNASRSPTRSASTATAAGPAAAHTFRMASQRAVDVDPAPGGDTVRIMTAAFARQHSDRMVPTKRHAKDVAESDDKSEPARAGAARKVAPAVSQGRFPTRENLSPRRPPPNPPRIPPTGRITASMGP